MTPSEGCPATCNVWGEGAAEGWLGEWHGEEESRWRHTGPRGVAGRQHPVADRAAQGSEETGSETERLALVTGQGGPEARWRRGQTPNPVNGGWRAPNAHKESLLSVALSQTLNPDPAPGPPEGPEVGEAAEKSHSEPSRGEPPQAERGPEGYAPNSKEQSQDTEDERE